MCSEREHSLASMLGTVYILDYIFIWIYLYINEAIRGTLNRLGTATWFTLWNNLRYIGPHRDRQAQGFVLNSNIYLQLNAFRTSHRDLFSRSVNSLPWVSIKD